MKSTHTPQRTPRVEDRRPYHNMSFLTSLAVAARDAYAIETCYSVLLHYVAKRAEDMETLPEGRAN